ncbi:MULTISPECIES: SAM-dependent methyltransferase [unclassified Streptomyces]|uniref:SAM-dependent methyltransferase n=1 Tax=unclassified Streptomyces TaxID=2593676 RepID=UPI000CD4D0A5|nr:MULTISPECIES: SAM-dependent methyltransferase [unclassified Streptomyces]
MTGGTTDGDAGTTRRIDTSVPHSARIWNYWLGGKDNYPVDREAGDAFREVFPGIVDIARCSRHLLARAVRHLVTEEGVRQFLDVGTGLPTVDNTHQVAQRAAPDARVVYVDNDPLVLAHARALLTSTPEGSTTYVDADLREPERIVAAAGRSLDLTRPVALILMGVIGHVADHDEARSIVRRLLAGLPSGSFLLLYDGTDASASSARAQDSYNEGGALPYVLRTEQEIGAFFDGLDLLEPGLVPLPRWRPEIAGLEGADVAAVCAVGRKP